MFDIASGFIFQTVHYFLSTDEQYLGSTERWLLQTIYDIDINIVMAIGTATWRKNLNLIFSGRSRLKSNKPLNQQFG